MCGIYDTTLCKTEFALDDIMYRRPLASYSAPQKQDIYTARHLAYEISTFWSL